MHLLISDYMMLELDLRWGLFLLTLEVPIVYWYTEDMTPFSKSLSLIREGQ